MAPAAPQSSPFSGTLTRFVVLASGLVGVMFAVGAPFMVRVVRTDGGTWTEYLFFALYAAVLTAGFATATLLGGAVARRLGGDRAEQLLALAFATVTGLALLSDEVAFTLLGTHPYGRVILGAISTDDIRRLPWWSVLGAVGIVAAVLMAAAAMWAAAAADRSSAGALWSRIERQMAKRVMLYFPVGLATFMALDQPDAERVVPRAALPFYALWLAPENEFPDARPSYPIGYVAPTPAFTRRPTIVFLMADSWRWDVMTPEATPFLARLATSAGCTSAPRHYPSGHITQYGTFALLNGLDAYAFLPFMQEGRESLPLNGLKRAGYRLEAYDASGVANYSTPPLRISQFDYFEAFSEDSVAIGRTIASLRKPSAAPRFVFAFMNSTHATYQHPPAWDRFPTGYGEPKIDATTRLFNAYRNSAGYVDSLVARVYRVLEPDLASGRAVLIVTSDHGEEFWEYGLQGHSAVRFYDVRTRVPFIACFAGAKRLKPALSTHADVFPTVFDWMGAGGWDSTRLTGRSLLDSPGDRVVSVTGVGFPTQASAFALVTPTHKFWLRLGSASLDSIVVDRVTDTLDVMVPMTEAARLDFAAARQEYLRKQHAVLQVDGGR